MTFPTWVPPQLETGSTARGSAPQLSFRALGSPDKRRLKATPLEIKVVALCRCALLQREGAQQAGPAGGAHLRSAPRHQLHLPNGDRANELQDSSHSAMLLPGRLPCGGESYEHVPTVEAQRP